MASLKNKPESIWAVFAVVLVASGVIYRAPLHQFRSAAPSQPPVTNAPTAVVSTAAAVPSTSHSVSQSRPTADPLQKARALLGAGPSRQTAHRQLTGLRESLFKMPRDAAISAIRQFLDSKADAPTHLGFKVASDGLLDEAPTLRTFLLDEMGRLDSTSAAHYAKLVLESKDSPDEWAVALRNLARGDTSDAGQALLLQKTGEMLQYKPWQQDPSVGFLEAFDTAVFLGGTNLVPTLSSLVTLQNNPAVAHAAYLALDRLVINEPATILATLESEPDLMQGREATRANYFARADVSDPRQRQILESYLLNSQISAPEISVFAGLYPSGNFMISPNLLTQTVTPDHAALISRDAASLSVAQEWLADPKFADLQPALTKITLHLQGLMRQAAGQ